jgi:hypothetical protein
MSVYLLAVVWEAAAGVGGLQPCGRVSEDQSALLGEPEQRAHRGGRGAELVAAQRIQHGSDVIGGDLAEVAAVCRPALDERLGGREVDVDAGVRAGPCPGIAIEQHQQPGPDRAGETLGQLAGAALDPGADRGDAVIVQQVKPG